MGSSMWNSLKETQRNLRQIIYDEEEFRPRLDQDVERTMYNREPRRPQQERVRNTLGVVRGTMNEMKLFIELDEHDDVDWSAWRPGDMFKGSHFKLYRKKNVPAELDELITEKHGCSYERMEEDDQWHRVICPEEWDERVRRND